MRLKTRPRRSLALAAPLVALALAGCDPASQAMLAGASLVTFVHSDKTIGDHVATWAFDKDCSTLTLANGEGYCHEFVSEEETAAAEADAQARMNATYCYRTLGGIDCYRQPDAMASSAARVR
jgi:hypothetical protein